MQCVEFEDRLNRLLDHRLVPEDDEQLVAHAHDCEACGEVLYAQNRLFAGLAVMPAPPRDLADQILARRHIETQARRSAWTRLGWTALFTAAASLGVITLARFAKTDLAPPAHSVATNASDKNPSQPKRREHAGGLAIATVGIASNNSSPASPEEAKQLAEYRRYLEDLAKQVGDSDIGEVGGSLSPTIRPIQSSFELAIDALWRTLPRGREPRPSKPEAGAFQWDRTHQLLG